MKQEFPEGNFRKIGFNTRGCPLFRELREMFWIFSDMQAEIFGQMESVLESFC